MKEPGAPEARFRGMTPVSHRANAKGHASERRIRSSFGQPTSYYRLGSASVASGRLRETGRCSGGPGNGWETSKGRMLVNGEDSAGSEPENDQRKGESRLLNQYRVDFRNTPWEVPLTGMRHRVARQSGRILRVVEYTKEMEPHWCSRGHTGMILSGRFEVRFETHTETYSEGDGVFIPGGEEHRHKGVPLTEVVRAIFVEEE